MRSAMNDISNDTLCDIFALLEPGPEIVRRLDKWGSPYNSQKAHTVLWLASQGTTGEGAYSRKKGNSSGRTCYNRILNPGILIWIASVLGADEQTIERATAEAVEAEKTNYRKRCSAFRSVISFDDVLELLHRPDEWKYDVRMLGLYSMGEDRFPHIVDGMEDELEKRFFEEAEE